MLIAVKTMSASLKKILLVEFGEVRFEPVILRSKTSLKPTTRQRGRDRANITRHDGFDRELKILRAGSEGLRLFGPLVQSFRPRPQRSLKNGANRPICESEMESRR